MQVERQLRPHRCKSGDAPADRLADAHAASAARCAARRRRCCCCCCAFRVVCALEPCAGAAEEKGDNVELVARERARRAVRALARSYDLEGLLAGIIVFHRTATMAASEAVRAVLASNAGLLQGKAGDRTTVGSPEKKRRALLLTGAAARLASAEEQEEEDAMLTHGTVIGLWANPAPAQLSAGRWEAIQRKAWSEHLQILLRECPMFGLIERAGKDSSGNDLQPMVYYQHEHDHDRDRAMNLKTFVKPIRGALKTLKVSPTPRTRVGSAYADAECAGTHTLTHSHSRSSGRRACTAAATATTPSPPRPLLLPPASRRPSLRSGKRRSRKKERRPGIAKATRTLSSDERLEGEKERTHQPTKTRTQLSTIAPNICINSKQRTLS